MNKFALFLWWCTIIILFTGYLGFLLTVAIASVIILLYLLFYKYLLHRQWRKEQRDYLDALFQYENREEYERKRQEYIDNWGKDPGSYDERHDRLKRELAKIK